MILNSDEIYLASSLPVKFYGTSGIYSDFGVPNNNKRGNYDFADYRHFTPGDDIRNIDWRHYIDKKMIVVKERERIEIPEYYIYIDLSDSVVHAGENKTDTIRKIASVIVLLLHRYSAKIQILNYEDKTNPVSPIIQKLNYLFESIENIALGGTMGADNFADTLPVLEPNKRLIIISDMICSDGPEFLLDSIAGRCSNSTLFNVYTDSEFAPSFDGAYVFCDAESGDEMTTYVDDMLKSEYLNVYRQYFDTLKQESMKKNWVYYDINADMPLKYILKEISFSGFVYL